MFHQTALLAEKTSSLTIIMQLNAILSGLILAACATAIPVESPIELMKRAPSPGVVITKCAKPGVLALAFDDGPYQYTQQLVNTLNAAGAKGTFFMTGTLYGKSRRAHAYVQGSN
jgi:hypothetical protein